MTFPEGTVIVVCAYSGNRDPAVFAHPETFDITGEGKGPRMLTFGAGIHYCVGANLARAELEEALAFLAREIRTLNLDGEPVLQSVSGIYGTDALPIAFEAA